jgi:pimeloyl-ACP methyl ester carboxylesterase
LGNDSTTWKLVAGPIAQFARVVLYDRAGLGQSRPMKNKDSAITADEVATNLHALLSAADIRPPYLLVGHSLGGLYMQMFARKYPRDVSGIVLLESSSADAPSELKTRARLEPGTPAYLEEEGVPESNRQVANGGPLTAAASPRPFLAIRARPFGGKCGGRTRGIGVRPTARRRQKGKTIRSTLPLDFHNN